MTSFTARAQAEAAARREREAAALRLNLRRRKAQIRAREDDCEMPTILRAEGYRVYFYSGDRDELPHVHVDRGGASAKIWLENVSLANNAGYKPQELSDLLSLIRSHRQLCLEKWHGFFRPDGDR